MTPVTWTRKWPGGRGGGGPCAFTRLRQRLEKLSGFEEIICMFYLQFRWRPETRNKFVNHWHMSLFPQCKEYDQINLILFSRNQVIILRTSCPYIGHWYDALLNEDHLKVPDSEHDQSLAATPSSSAIREASKMCSLGLSWIYAGQCYIASYRPSTHPQWDTRTGLCDIIQVTML